MSINKQPGYKAKIRIGSGDTPFGVQRINYRREQGDVDVKAASAYLRENMPAGVGQGRALVSE